MSNAYIAGPMRGYPRYNFDAFDACAGYLNSVGIDVASPAEHDRAGGFDPDGPLNGFDMEAAMRWDLTQVLCSDMVVMLPGWEASVGASLEYEVARKTGKRVYAYKPEKDRHHKLWLIDDDEPIEARVVSVADTRYLDDADDPELARLLAEEAEIERRCRLTVDEEEEAHASVLAIADRLIHGSRNGAYGHPLDDFSRTALFWSNFISEATGSEVWLEPEHVGWMMVLLKMSREINKHGHDNLVDGGGYIGTIEMVHDERARRDAQRDAA